MVVERSGAGWIVGLLMVAGCPSPSPITETETGDASSTSTGGVTSGGSTGDDLMTSTEAPDDTSSSDGPPPSCDDGIQNQDESATDCGGSCAACPAGQACNLNSDCTTQACDGGTCVVPGCLVDADCPGTPNPCMAGVCKGFECGVAAGNEGKDCEDDELCSLTSTCQSGACAPSESIDCSGLDSACTQGQCDPLSGACLVGDLPDGNDCDDGNSCTADSICKAGSCVATGAGALFFEDFSAPAAGWQLDQSWQIGPAVVSPVGAGGTDPADDHSDGDDDMIAGTVIGGLDTTPGHARWCLSSPTVDTTQAAGSLWVSFWRHLHAPALPAAKHTVEVFSGGVWTVLETGYDVVSNDDDWTFVKFDASGKQSKTFRVRICLERVGAGQNFAGWSVDDLTIAPLPCTP